MIVFGSALDHILAGDQTIPDDKGLFVDESWRLTEKVDQHNTRAVVPASEHIAEIFKRVDEGPLSLRRPGIGNCRHALFMADARLFLLDAIVPGELAIAVEQFLLLPVTALWQLEAVIAGELTRHRHHPVFEEGEWDGLALLSVDA